jgi:beta-fructofuranosidase
MQASIQNAQAHVAQMQPVIAGAKMRQRYHFMAPSGWINDPNGLIYFRGKYHFFYQYNPYDAVWGAMHWGHAVSEDLLHWEHLPIALAPSEPYDDDPRGGCFSGSAIEHEGKLYLLYTGAVNHGAGAVQTQCLAYSVDGVTFEKYAGNPVITTPAGYSAADFRDPKVWKHGDSFYLVLGAKKDDRAQALLYRSDNLREWEFVNVLAESRGELGSMWECPDFFALGGKHVLTFSPMGLGERKAVYLVGEMDYNTGKFHYTAVGELDWGFDYYAPYSFPAPDGRRIVVAWANGWDWLPWWKDWGPTYPEGWCGWFALPREMRLLPDGRLQFVPVKELEQLRQDERLYADLQVDAEPFEFAAGDGPAFELDLEIDLRGTTAERFTLLLRCGAGRQTAINFDLRRSEMTFDRGQADGWSTGVTRSPLNLTDKETLNVRVFSDQSSIEVFVDDGRTVHSGNVFAGNEQNRNFIVAAGGRLQINRMQMWGIKRAID